MERLSKGLSICSQSIMVLGAVIGMLVFVGRPLAQEFIIDTIDERIGQLEAQQRSLQTEQQELQQGQATLTRSIQVLSGETTDASENTEEILKIIKQLQAQ